ncbi:MAG: hypothetical protein KR126chlam1_00741 [Chlamydiae bacterium]|nr:hypothetical protein [Chlamydiota bacterium]
MRIKIDLSLCPYSHLSGICCLIPFTSWEAQIFPAKIFFHNLSGKESWEQSLPIEGPIRGFTVILDLERSRIAVSGRGKRGFFRFFLSHEGIAFAKGGEITLPFSKSESFPKVRERLSLGIHKKQDWELVCRRGLMSEVFPFWIALAQQVPHSSVPKTPVGNFSLLSHEVEKGNVVSHFQTLFQTGFVGILSPRILDETYQGILADEEVPAGVSPLGIIHEGARQIRALFFRETGGQIALLSALPKEFHAGRYVHLQSSFGDQFDIEWSKKEIKKVVITPGSTRDLLLSLQRGIRSFRVRKSPRQKGERVSRDTPLSLREGEKLYLDRFQH